jgi:Viral (Superfamily 1) RNA helicase
LLRRVNPLGRRRAKGLYETIGFRSSFPRDRIVFLENEYDLGVRNGMLGTVERVETGRIVAGLDGKGDSISIPTDEYRSFDHGYATTIHKTQGATVDRSFVLASATMDRHLTYVAMTRHRDDVKLYAGQDEFADRLAGRLIEHGKAPYENAAGNRASYYVTLENDRGQQHTIWGLHLQRAMKEAAPKIGDKIRLQHTGSETVQLPNGQTAERNSWRVQSADELAYRQLEARLSRSGAKETTLDYTRDFAERRGISEPSSVRSESEPRSERGVDARANPGRTAGGAAGHRGRKGRRRSRASFPAGTVSISRAEFLKPAGGFIPLIQRKITTGDALCRCNHIRVLPTLQSVQPGAAIERAMRRD